MKRLIQLGDSLGELEWSGPLDATTFRLQWPDAEAPWHAASLVEAEPGVYSVLVGGRSFEAKIVKAASGWAVDVDGRRYLLDVVDPRSMERRGSAMSHDGQQRLTAPMPGKVVRVLVEAGQQVAAGQGLVVVEAMKMQNEVKSPRDGRVVSLLATPGATVTPGETLVVLE
jgi:biotin carboxyl carrier protein